MSKRKYYVHYYMDFFNTYSLRYVDPDMPFVVPDGWQRITRKEAVALAREESHRVSINSSFSGAADDAVRPAMVHEFGDRRWVTWEDKQWAGWKYSAVRNYIQERG